jgi:hypothetical protein
LITRAGCGGLTNVGHEKARTVAGLRCPWCRHPDSNWGPTDYKSVKSGSMHRSPASRHHKKKALRSHLNALNVDCPG